MIYERKRDPEGHLRIVEGVDYVYTVVALTIGHFSKKQDIGVNLIIKIPYTKQLMNKLLIPNEARSLALALEEYADLAEKLRNETFSVEPM